MSIENVRNMAHSHLSVIANGKNPAVEKKKVQNENTLGELFSTYLERHAKPHKKARSCADDEANYRRHLFHWNERKLSNISKNDIALLHITIGKNRGQYVANRILALLHTMFNKAIAWGWQGTNPAFGIRKFKEKSRDRFLQPHELPYFFDALESEENKSAKDYIMLSLLTGARKSTVLAMRWDQITVEQAKWRIPETKNGEPVIIPLSLQVIDILKLRKKDSFNPWVFPSEASKTGHIKDPNKAWQRLLKRAEIYQLINELAEVKKWESEKIEKMRKAAEENLEDSLIAHRNTAIKHKLDTSQIAFHDIRIHDLRRSLGSWQAVTGASSYVIGKSLGHKSQQATAIYARLNLDPVRASVEKATEAMMLAGKRKNR